MLALHFACVVVVWVVGGGFCVFLFIIIILFLINYFLTKKNCFYLDFKIKINKQKIIKVESGNFIAPTIETSTAEGRLEITTTGRGYVVCEELDGDVMIEQRNLNKGLHGDMVRVIVGSKNNRNKYEGKVLEVVKRNKDVFVGVFQKNKEFSNFPIF